jgi:hypothetical protein
VDVVLVVDGFEGLGSAVVAVVLCDVLRLEQSMMLVMMIMAMMKIATVTGRIGLVVLGHALVLLAEPGQDLDVVLVVGQEGQGRLELLPAFFGEVVVVELDRLEALALSQNGLDDRLDGLVGDAPQHVHFLFPLLPVPRHSPLVPHRALVASLGCDRVVVALLGGVDLLQGRVA